MNFKEFEEFEEETRLTLGDDIYDLTLVDVFDHEAHIERLNRHAESVLGLGEGERVDLKIIWYKGTQIHTLIFRVFKNARMYTAGLERRLSLGLIDRGGDRWQTLLKEAYELAMAKPAVGLDPELESISSFKASSGNGGTRSRMTFRLAGEEGEARVVITAKKGVTECSGPENMVIEILTDLVNRGLK